MKKLIGLKKNHINVLNLEFDDVTEDTEFNGHLLKAMTEEQAQKCVDFIENNIGKHIYIHCRAGISRSGAIAKFIVEFYNENNIRKRTGHFAVQQKLTKHCKSNIF